MKANKELIGVFQGKIKEVVGRVWGRVSRLRFNLNIRIKQQGIFIVIVWFCYRHSNLH